MENEVMEANVQPLSVAGEAETCMRAQDFAGEAEVRTGAKDSTDEPATCAETSGLAREAPTCAGAQGVAGEAATCTKAQAAAGEAVACGGTKTPASEAAAPEGSPANTAADADSDEPCANEELISLLAQQAAGYELLGRLFQREVDAELLGSLCEGRYPARTGNDHLDEGYRGLVVFLNHRGERTGTELNVDYLHVFIGNTQDTSHVAYPYESVYTSPDHLLMQDARDAVLAAYRSEMVTLVNEHNEPEDHMGFELAFCAVLLSRAAEALTAGDIARAAELVEKERSFVRDHLGVWAPEFASDVKRIARTGFYRALADILLGYLEVDSTVMESLSAELGE